MADDRDQQPGGPNPPAPQDEYPGPRRASSGEEVYPNPGDPPRPGHVGAREGEPSAASDRATGSRGGPAGASDGGFPSARSTEDEATPRATDFPVLPHRDSDAGGRD